MSDEGDSRSRFAGLLTFRALLLLGVVLGATVALAAPMIVPQTSGAPFFGASNGPSISVPNAQGVSYENTEFAPAPDTTQIVSDSGNMTLVSQGYTRAVVDSVSGTWTNTSGLNVSTALTLNPEDKRRITVQGSTDTLDWTDYRVDDGNTDVSWSGTSGTTNLTFYGLPTNTEIALVENGTILDQGTSSGSGTLALEVPNSEHSASLTTDTNDAPQLSNPSPDGSVSNQPVQLSIDVDDEQFSGGDSVTVNFSVDGSQVDSKTVTSAGTVTTTVSGLTAGTHDWSVTATDSFGQTTTAGPYSVDIPSNLTFRWETNGTVITSSNISIKATFFAENTVIERTDTNSDGVINLSGLPVGQTFIVQVDADGAYSRTVVIESLVEQQTAYLLPTSADGVEIQWELDDATGNFPSDETKLFIEAAVNTSSGTEYRTIAGEEFGASNSISTTLQNGERYRLRVKNGDRTRSLGSYKVTGPANEVIPIGTVEFKTGNNAQTALNARLEKIDGQRYVRIEYRDAQRATEKLYLHVYRTDNKSEVLRVNSSVLGPFGRYVETIPVTANESEDVSYTIEWTAVRSDAGDKSGKEIVGSVQGTQVPIGETVLSYIGIVALVSMIGLVAIWDASASLIVGSVFATGMTIFGIIAIPAPLLGIAGAIAVLSNIGRVT